MNRSTTEQSPPAPEATPFDDGALYDIFFERLDLGLDFHLGLAQAAGGPVLDVACGTGRIMLPCLKAGGDVQGLDLFPGMLTRLRQKASALGFEPKLHHANMAAFRLPRRYALVMIPFNAFVHNLTSDDQLATLQSCRHHLEPDCAGLDRSRCKGGNSMNCPNTCRKKTIPISAVAQARAPRNLAMRK